jgi:8-oxo-dGTP diphosphatase
VSLLDDLTRLVLLADGSGRTPPATARRPRSCAGRDRHHPRAPNPDVDCRTDPRDDQGWPLPFDHADIVERGVARARQEYAARPDPAGFLVRRFTLRQLKQLHEAVAGEELPRDTFRRRVEPELRATGELRSGQVGKPARLFERA